MKRKLLSTCLIFLMTTAICLANTNLLKFTPTSGSGVINVSNINDGSYASFCQILSGTKYLYFTLDNDLYTKASHCYLFLDSNVPSNASFTLYGRNNGGTWYTLGYVSSQCGKFIDIPLSGNHYVDQIRLRVYSPTTLLVKEVVYTSNLESVSSLAISPSMSYHVDRLRDGLTTPYLEFSGAKRTIYYDLKDEYEKIKISIDYRNQYYSSARVKIYFYRNGNYYLEKDENIFTATYSPNISYMRTAEKIKIELEGSHNQGDDVSVEEISIDGYKVDKTIHYPQSYFSYPVGDYRPMAEWEESEGILVSWNHTREDKHNNYIIKLVQEIDKVGNVYLVCNNIAHLKSKFGNLLNNLNNTEIIYVESKVYSYSRDLLPIGLYNESNQTRIGSTIHSSYSQDAIMSYLDIPVYFDPEIDNSLSDHLDGGNFSTDGNNTAIVNHSNYLNNAPNRADFTEKLENLFSCEKQLLVEAPLIGVHVDKFMKIVNEETIIIESDYYNHNLSIVGTYNQQQNTNFQLSKISSDFYYTNSLIFNNTVFVPLSHHVEDQSSNQNAISTFEANMPGYNIVPVYTEPNASTGEGSIHCLTQNVPAKDPVWISHTKIPNQPNDDNDFPVVATIKSPSGITSARVYYKSKNSSNYSSKTLNRLSGTDKFTGLIPPIDGASEMQYYLSATNGNDKTRTKPYPGAAGPYSFIVGVSKSSNEHAFSNHRSTSSIQVYPNPADNILTIDPGNAANLEVKLFGLDGSIVLCEIINGIYHIDISHVESGIYLLKVVDNELNNLKSTYKIAIQ